MNKWFELLLGIVLIAAPIVVSMFLHLGKIVRDFIIGGVVISVFLLGIMFLVLAINDIKG